MQTVKLQTNSTAGIPRGLLVLALLVILLWGLSAASPFFIPVSISVILAFLMNPLVRFLERIHLPNWLAVTISTLVLVLPILLVVSFLVVEIQGLVSDLPSLLHALDAQIGKLAQLPIARRFHAPASLSILLDRAQSSAGTGVTIFLAGLRTFLEKGSEFVLILLFAVTMLASRKHLRRCAESLLAQCENIESVGMLEEVTGLVEKFLTGRLLIVAVVGIARMVALRLFGISYSLLIGLFIGVMTLVPEVGFVIGLVPPVAVALAHGTSVGGVATLVGVLVAIHVAESYVLVPKMIGQRLNINLLTTFLGLFAGGLLWGVWGMFLSVPILGVLRIAFSAAPTLRPWGELMAERDDPRLIQRLLRRSQPVRAA